MSNHRYEPDVRVKLRFLTTAEGGRKTLAYSNYRPQFFYAGQHYVVNHKFPKEGVAPGETTEAELAFATPMLLQGQIHPGTPFEIYEGSKKVAEGEILQVLALEENAQKQFGRTKTQMTPSSGLFSWALIAAIWVSGITQVLVILLTSYFGTALQKLSIHHDGLVVGYLFLSEGAVAFLGIIAAASVTPPVSRRAICWQVTFACLALYSLIFLHVLLPFERQLHPHSTLYRWVHDSLLLCFSTGGICASLYVTLRHGKPLFPLPKFRS